MDTTHSFHLIVGVQIGIIAIILLICSLLVATQKAMRVVSRNIIREMAEEGNKKAEKIMRLIDDSSSVNATVFAVLIFFGLLVGEIITISYQSSIGLLLDSFNVPYASLISLLLITLIVALCFLVFVIFLPRQIAIKKPVEVSMKLIRFFRICQIIVLPIVGIVRFVTNILLKITRQGTISYDESFSKEDVMSMLEVGQETGALKEEGKKMINSIFAFDNILAYEVMTPRTDVFSIDLLDEADEYFEELMELKYSRVPVYEEDSDNIIGILNIKDFFIKAKTDGFENVKVKDILREPFFVPETKNIDSLFFELQKTKQHIAILIDEYGGFSGIVTMEDIIEEVMGEIDDEYDEEEHDIEKIAENKYLIDGFMDLDDINESIGTNLESNTSETVGGLIIDILGEIPSEDTENIIVNYENYEFTVESIKDRRIDRVVLLVKTEDVLDNDDDKES